MMRPRIVFMPRLATTVSVTTTTTRQTPAVVRRQRTNNLLARRRWQTTDNKSQNSVPPSNGGGGGIKTTTTSTVNLEEPTFRQLRIVALRSAIPMVGFGFMDNLVMIQAGEAIDLSIGVAFGLSTLTAAGFGQCVSDVAGFTCGGLVDAGVARLKLPQHNLSQLQLGLKSSRIAHTMGGCVGVVFGCLLGMSCLLFKDTERAERAKKAKELQSIFESILEEGHTLIGAERASLWLLDEDTATEQKIIWSRVASGVDGVIQAPLKKSIVGDCIMSGQIINLANAYEDPRFDQAVDQKTGFTTRQLLAVPVFNDEKKVIGAIEVINKNCDNQNDDAMDTVFSEGDIKCVKMLCSHVSSFLKIVYAS